KDEFFPGRSLQKKDWLVYISSHLFYRHEPIKAAFATATEISCQHFNDAFEKPDHSVLVGFYSTEENVEVLQKKTVDSLGSRERFFKILGKTGQLTANSMHLQNPPRAKL